MILCIDLGNTTFSYAEYENNCLILKNRFLTNKHALKIAIDNILHPMDAVIVSSVVPSLNKIIKKRVWKKFKLEPIFVDSSFDCGFKIDVMPEDSLGSDLFVAAVAAANKYGVPNIVVDLGTAITVFATSANQHFLGGMIYPGIRISFQNLLKKAALLQPYAKDLPFQEPPAVIGKTTVDSLNSGIIYGTISMIKGSICRFKDEIKEDSARVILTGGDAGKIYSYFPDYLLDETLILDGLNIIYHKMKAEK